jgi:glycosyltransferase involved in cell wall biosynthesis
MSVQISAIICTRNRADYLRKAVQSLVDQTLSKDLYEIIVVDNGSTDNTGQVVEEFDSPNLRYIYEPVPGLSKARNTGWQNAQGEYIAFLDDDAVADPHWLERYVSAFRTSEVMPGSIGGRANPIWEIPQPDWLSDRMLTILSVYHWSDEFAPLKDDQWVAGCNIAYPREVLEEIDGFREDLGRIGNRLLSGEESFVRLQLDKRGYASMYHPDIIIGHHVSPGRLQKSWFRRHGYGAGQTEAFMLQFEQELPLTKRMMLAAKQIIRIVPRLPLMVFAPDPAQRFRRQYQVIEALGFLSVIWRQPKHSPEVT